MSFGSGEGSGRGVFPSPMGFTLMSRLSPFFMGSVNCAGFLLTSISTVTRLVAEAMDDALREAAVHDRVWSWKTNIK